MNPAAPHPRNSDREHFISSESPPCHEALLVESHPKIYIYISPIFVRMVLESIAAVKSLLYGHMDTCQNP